MQQGPGLTREGGRVNLGASRRREQQVRSLPREEARSDSRSGKGQFHLVGHLRLPERGGGVRADHPGLIEGFTLNLHTLGTSIII